MFLSVYLYTFLSSFIMFCYGNENLCFQQKRIVVCNALTFKTNNSLR
jgi:hypothetical protein